MSWFKPAAAARVLIVVLLGAATAGCFQPMYADRSVTGSPALRDKLRTVDVPQLNVPRGSREARVGQEIRNALLFNLYGSATGDTPSYTLTIKLKTTRLSVIVDVTTSRPDIENYGIDATYELKEVSTGKIVMTASTFSRVSYDIPGQEQRFARERGFRDAEDRAAKEIADAISTRLASFFYAGT